LQRNIFSTIIFLIKFIFDLYFLIILFIICFLESQGYSIYKVLSFFEHRCLFSLPILCLFAAYGNISTTSQYLVL